jgi:hypothetical protein
MTTTVVQPSQMMFDIDLSDDSDDSDDRQDRQDRQDTHASDASVASDHVRVCTTVFITYVKGQDLLRLDRCYASLRAAIARVQKQLSAMHSTSLYSCVTRIQYVMGIIRLDDVSVLESKVGTIRKCIVYEDDMKYFSQEITNAVCAIVDENIIPINVDIRTIDDEVFNYHAGKTARLTNLDSKHVVHAI